MRHQTTAILAPLATLAIVLALASPAAASTTHLFVDDHLVASGHFTRTFHQPVKDPGGPLLTAPGYDTPATLEANGTIVYDSRQRLWVMFAVGYSPSAPADPVRLFRYTSANGLAWSQPTRIILPTLATSDVFSAYYTTTDPFHYQAWVYLYGIGQDGTYYIRSTNGVNWQIVRQVIKAESQTRDSNGHPVVGPADVNLFYHDPVTGRFVGSFKFYSYTLLGPYGSRIRSRSYQWLDTIDQPVDTATLELGLVPAWDQATEFYASTVWRYADMWLGTLKIYDDSDGRARLDLVSSDDAMKWQPAAGFLPNASEGTGDGGYMTDFSQGPIRVGSQLVYYYGSSAWGKKQASNVRVSGGGVFRARLRVDGFASITGTVTTKLQRFPGRHLTVNADGPVMVQVLNSAGRLVGQATMTGDRIVENIKVRLPAAGWLRFIARGDLYSYTIG